MWKAKHRGRFAEAPTSLEASLPNCMPPHPWLQQKQSGEAHPPGSSLTFYFRTRKMGGLPHDHPYSYAITAHTDALTFQL